MKKEFKNKNLDYSNFSNSCLIGVNFINCSLRFCSFSNSDLSYSTFNNCDIYCANFHETVLYTTRFIECDATKANFSTSYMNGLRIRDTDVTHTKFGFYFNTGYERKPITIENKIGSFLSISLGIGNLPKSTKEIENEFDGIFCKSNNILIRFYKTDEEIWRVWRRKSEIAKIIKNILEENGYNDKSTNYYFLHRKFLRKSNQNWFFRNLDYFWGELFWGYGVRISNPIMAFFINCLFFSFVYSILPIFIKNSGIEINGKIISVFNFGYFNTMNYLEILYWSVLISSLSVFGDMNMVGWAKVFSLIHVLISVISIGLGVSALAKKMSNI